MFNQAVNENDAHVLVMNNASINAIEGNFLYVKVKLIRNDTQIHWCLGDSSAK